MCKTCSIVSFVYKVFQTKETFFSKNVFDIIYIIFKYVCTTYYFYYIARYTLEDTML